MASQHPFDRGVLFFGGKGGVGKTTLAAASALRAADTGHDTLLVSTDPAHSTGDVLATALGPEPSRVTERLWAQEIDPAAEADRYIAEVRERIAGTVPPRLAGEVNRQIDIARVTPGAEEAALFDRFTKILDGLEGRFGRILFDTAPLGYTLRLLGLPEMMTAWINGLIGRRKHLNAVARMWRTVAGSASQQPVPDDPVLATLHERHDRFARARTVLLDGARTGFVLVATAEYLAVTETERAAQTLERYGIPVGALIINRLRGHATEREHCQRLRAVADRLPVYELSEQVGEVRGIEALRQFGRGLLGN